MTPVIVRGKYGEAQVYTHNADSTAISQIIELCNEEWTTRKENVQHAYDTGLRDNVRKINSIFCKN
jgi:hypothetical protein